MGSFSWRLSCAWLDVLGLTNAMCMEPASIPLSFLRKPTRHSRTLLCQRPIHLGGAIPGLLLEDERRPNYLHAIDQCHDHGACLQTTVFKLSLIRSARRSRTLIRERHIRFSKQISDIPSFPVRVGSEKRKISALIFPPGGCRPSRVRSA